MAAISQATATLTYGAPVDLTGKTGSIVSRRFSKLISLPLGGVLEMAMNNKLPYAMEIGVFDEAPPPHAPIRQTHGFDNLVVKAVSMPFVFFYDENQPWIENTFKSYSYNWPSIFNFARVVRNGIAHKNLIHFKNPSAPPVSWQSVTFGPTDHGKPLFTDGFWVADLLLLMFEMSDELFKHGVHT